MSERVVEMRGEPRAAVTDFWFAQLERRLAAIEELLARLERQVWMLMGVGLGLMAFDALRLSLSYLIR